MPIKFPGQRPNEVVQYLVRKHWIIDIKVGSFLLVFGLLPVALAVITPFFWDGQFTEFFFLTLLGVLVYTLILLLTSYIKWLNEELDMIVVTNERIIAHDQVDIFHREISETSISQVQDVKGTENGLLGHLFHFGKLEIQTAAMKIVFTIKNVESPYQNARHILDIRDKYLEAHNIGPNTVTTAPASTNI